MSASLLPAAAGPVRQGARTPRRLALIGLGVLVGHLALWASLASALAEPAMRPEPHVQALLVRQVAASPEPVPALAPEVLAPQLAARPAQAATRSATPEHTHRPTPVVADTSPTAPPAAMTNVELDASPALHEAVYRPGDDAAPPVLRVATTAAMAVAAAPPTTLQGEAAAAEPPQVYRTHIPPAMRIDYTMHRGMVSGRGELQWRPSGGRYQARLEGRALGMTLLMWASDGGFDAAGLAPVRFTEKRIRKSEQAANFQRALGKITYSGPAVEYPLVAGAQDRLSWMLQLAAIAAAEPQRLVAGQRISVFVSGAKGDADVWAFRVIGAETVNATPGKLAAVKLLREPRKPHDTRVEVWLGPQHHYVPVRVRLSSAGDGDALEFLLDTLRLS